MLKSLKIALVKYTDLVGIEPTVSGLEVQRPIQARLQAHNICYYYNVLYLILFILCGFKLNSQNIIIIIIS